MQVPDVILTGTLFEVVLIPVVEILLGNMGLVHKIYWVAQIDKKAKRYKSQKGYATIVLLTHRTWIIAYDRGGKGIHLRGENHTSNSKITTSGNSSCSRANIFPLHFFSTFLCDRHWWGNHRSRLPLELNTHPSFVTW